MTDYSKVDFTELKLEPIGAVSVHANSSHSERVDLFSGCTSIMYKLGNQEWCTTSYSAGLSRSRLEELFKRTEQVDEFIRQKSRRRITVLQLARELIDDEREICIQAQQIGAVMRYRFDRLACRFEFYDAGCWHRSPGLGDHRSVVTIIDWPPCRPSSKQQSSR